MVKDFRFVLTLHNVHDHITRGEVKAKLEALTSSFTKKNQYCESVRISRYNLSNEVRRGRAMQKMAEDVLARATNNKNGNKKTEGK